MATKSKSKSRLNFGFGAIYQRKTQEGNVRWYLDYRNPEGQRIQKVASLAISKEDAFLALQEAVRRKFDEEYRISREKEKVKFKELARMYIEDYAKSNKKSWKCDLYRIEANMKPFFGDYEVQEITPLLIEKYKAERLRSGITKSSVNRELTIMKKMFNLAIDWSLMERNPVVKVKLFSEKDTMKERILGADEESRLRVECPGYLRPILLVALHTGMRRGEILNLRWKQIDLQKRLIRAEHTKNGKNRLIPINDLLYQELLRLKPEDGRADLVFFNPRTGKPYTELKKSFKNACKKAGITDLRFHDLRHTFATRLIEAGADIITVKELLGHFSVRVTQRYTHPSQEQKEKAVDLLARNGAKEAEIQGNLLHISDMEKASEKQDSVKSSLLIN